MTSTDASRLLAPADDQLDNSSTIECNVPAEFRMRGGGRR